MRVFITRIIDNKGMQLLHDAGVETFIWTEKRELTFDEFVEHSKKCDALLSVGPNFINAAFLKECAHLKVISVHSTGYNRVDVEEATRLGIPVGNTPNVTSNAAADIAFLLILSVARQAFYHHKKILTGGWKFFEPTADLGQDLQNKTLGIFGLGAIGLQLAMRCKAAYNMNIIYCNRSHNAAADKNLGATKVSFEALLAQSDIISVHCQLTDETKAKFCTEAFLQMKPTAIFINTARGSIHNETDLYQAVVNRTIWGAGLDVTEPEPMLPDNPLLSLPTVAILPHIGSATIETRQAMAIAAVQNIIAGLNNKQIPYAINPQVYR